MEPYDFKSVLIDEIALEGLDGISLDLLWMRVEKTIRSPVTTKMKTRFWKFIVTRKCITFYLNPEPYVKREILDRYSILDESSGNLCEPDDYIEPYTYAPAENEYGSSVHFHKRKLIAKKNLLKKEYAEIESEYGTTMVMVASLEERWHALAGHLPISVLQTLTPMHYCCLEVIGRARENGEMSTGKSNLLKIYKDPKFLFYSKKILKKLNLVKEQIHTQKSNNRFLKSINLRLIRFYKPKYLSMPKYGVIQSIVSHLMAMPDQTDTAKNIYAKFPIDKSSTKKKWRSYTMFKFSETILTSKDKQGNEKRLHKAFVTLNLNSDDESSDSEDENMDTREPIQCQYKVGVNMLRQAYERLLESGSKGLTQSEISAVLGVGIYTSRLICRILKRRNVVREFMEDKGRQRCTKLVAVHGFSIDKSFLEEQQKYEAFLKENAQKRKANTAEDPVETPKKKVKPNGVEELESTTLDNLSCVITEVKIISDVKKVQKQIEANRPLTLKQLKFTNGLLKLIKEKKVLSGFQPLASIVARETSQPAFDTKGIKCMLQKLLMEGHIKVYSVKFPSKSLHVTLTCDPQVKPTDPILTNKLKNMSYRALLQNVPPKKRALTKHTQYTYPRYMKIRKLHELLLNIVYFENKVTYSLGPGFAFAMDVLKNSTVEFALGNMCNVDDVDSLKITDDVLDKHLDDVPLGLRQGILHSTSLQNTIKSNLKHLAYLGLIQLIERKEHPMEYADFASNTSNLLFYVNRNASVINTSGSWPIDNPPIKELEKRFVFNTTQDCKDYWNVVHTISVNTKINLPRRFQKTSIRPPLRQICEVPLHDNGERFGNGLGPCGFDSCFYMDVPHLWRTYLTRVKKSNKKIGKPKVTTKAKGLSIDIKKKPKQKTKRPKKVTVQKPNPVETRLKKRELARLSDAKWSKTEDDILIACKVAMSIMCPFPIAGCSIILNSVARYILASFDRQKSYGILCHKRMKKLCTTSKTLHAYEYLLNEMRRRPTLIEKYENLLKKIKQQSSYLRKIVKEARLPMMELVMAAMKVSEIIACKPKIPCVAMNYKDFYDKYSVIPMSQGKSTDTYATSYERDSTIGAIKESIVQVVTFTTNHILTLDVAKKIQDAFKSQSESMLRIALEELRQSGAIRAKDKVTHNYLISASIKVQDSIETSYRITVKYKRKWNSRLNGEFIDDVADNLLNKVPEADLKGSAEINCIFAELHAINALEFWPVFSPSVTGTGSIFQEEQLNAIDIEHNVKFKTGTFCWAAKKDYDVFADLYKDIDIEGSFEAMIRCQVIEIEDIERAQVENSLSDDKIIVYLREKGQEGANIAELQENCVPVKENLVLKLKEMESKKILKRVGFFNNRIVLYECTKTWAINLTDKYLIPAPWYTLDGDLEKDIFCQWAATIVNEIFEKPGCPLSYLVEKAQLISARNIQDICIFLKQCKCVTMKVVSHRKSDEAPGLFLDEEPPSFCDYNDYEMIENLLVFPAANMITRFAYIKRCVSEIGYFTISQLRYFN